MSEAKKPRLKRFIILSMIPLYFILAGLIVQPIPEILHGLYEIVVQPDILITDYIAIGGIGAAFINAGLLALLSIWVIYYLGVGVNGHTITSMCLMFGFSLFGKNLVNIWAIVFGVYFYAHYHRKKLADYIYVAIYGTSLSPIITQIMYMVNLPMVLRFLLTVFTGLTIGFVLPPLATHTHHSHKGYSLYNVGFASGIIATVMVTALKSIGIVTEARLVWSTGNNKTFFIMLTLLFVIMIGGGIIASGKKAVEGYLNILEKNGIGGTDYLRDMGFGATMINMGVNGFFAMIYLLMMGGELNGPTIGGIFTVIGFSATGKNIRNITPIMLGVTLSSIISYWSIDSPSAQLALLFSTTLAPVAGEFGVLVGVIAGFLHASVALNIGALYGGMNLYNNGFAGGIVAMFMVPIVQSVRDHRARANEELSL